MAPNHLHPPARTRVEGVVDLDRIALIAGSMWLFRPAPGRPISPVAIARSCIRKGARGRCYNVVDLVNHLEAELRAGRQGRTADQLVRRDFVILDELGYLPFAQAGGQLLFHLIPGTAPR